VADFPSILSPDTDTYQFWKEFSYVQQFL